MPNAGSTFWISTRRRCWGCPCCPCTGRRMTTGEPTCPGLRENTSLTIMATSCHKTCDCERSALLERVYWMNFVWSSLLSTLSVLSKLYGLYIKSFVRCWRCTLTGWVTQTHNLMPKLCTGPSALLSWPRHQDNLFEGNTIYFWISFFLVMTFRIRRTLIFDKWFLFFTLHITTLNIKYFTIISW